MKRRLSPLHAVPLLLCGAALSVSACGSSPGGGGGGGGGIFGKKCLAPEEHAPQLAPLAEAELPQSEIWVHSRVPLSRLSAKLAQEIPKTLASAKNRKVGAPGKATYKVTRGTPKIVQDKKTKDLQVRVPVSANISVCKPFGPTCIKYGSCKPKLEARFSVGTKLGENYEFAPPEGSIKATKRCVIGLDVTKEIEKIARREVAQVEKQIKGQWPALRPEAARGWKQLGRPLPLSPDTCFQIAPTKLAYRRPLIQTKAETKVLTGALGITGTLLPADSCEGKFKVPKLPAPQHKKKPPAESSLWFPEVLPLEEAKTALLESASGAWGGESGTLQVLDAQFGPEQVALHVESTGDICGRFWITAGLKHEAGADSLHLAGAALVGPAPEKESSRSAYESLLAHIEKVSAIPVGSSTWFAAERSAQLKSALMATLPEGVVLDMSPPQAGSATVVATTQGLYLHHPVTSSLTVTDF
jgi:hypothetical protein